MTDQPPPLHLHHPDPTFSLTPEARRGVAAGFDLDALERLLARTRPEFRDALLEAFRETGVVFSTGPLMIADPVLQEMLHEVWAPRWEHVREEAWDDPDMERFPGGEAARARRSAGR